MYSHGSQMYMYMTDTLQTKQRTYGTYNTDHPSKRVHECNTDSDN